MRKINLFQQLNSQNFNRVKKVRTGVKIITAIAKKSTLAVNPVALYFEAATCVTDAVYQYIKFQENKQITEILAVDVENIKEQIVQYSKTIEVQKTLIINSQLEHRQNVNSIEENIKIDAEKYELNNLVFKETGTILKFIKDFLEKEKQDMPDSKKISDIEIEYWKAISARNVALISIISKNNVYDVNL